MVCNSLATGSYCTCGTLLTAKLLPISLCSYPCKKGKVIKMLKIILKIAPVQEKLDKYGGLFSKSQFYHFPNYAIRLIVENHSWIINNINKLCFKSKDPLDGYLVPM